MKLFLTVYVLLFSSLSLAEQFLCVASAKTGFSYDDDSEEWRSVDFSIADDRFVIAPSESEGLTYEIKEIGEDFALIDCPNDFDSNGYLSCQNLLGDRFIFNKDSLRFSAVGQIGYLMVGIGEFFGSPITDRLADSPYLMIGECSSI